MFGTRECRGIFVYLISKVRNDHFSPTTFLSLPTFPLVKQPESDCSPHNLTYGERLGSAFGWWQAAEINCSQHTQCYPCLVTQWLPSWFLLSQVILSDQQSAGRYCQTHSGKKSCLKQRKLYCSRVVLNWGGILVKVGMATIQNIVSRCWPFLGLIWQYEVMQTCTQVTPWLMGFILGQRYTFICRLPATKIPTQECTAALASAIVSLSWNLCRIRLPIWDLPHTQYALYDQVTVLPGLALEKHLVGSLYSRWIGSPSG